MKGIAVAIVRYLFPGSEISCIACYEKQPLRSREPDFLRMGRPPPGVIGQLCIRVVAQSDLRYHNW